MSSWGGGSGRDCAKFEAAEIAGKQLIFVEGNTLRPDTVNVVLRDTRRRDWRCE